MARFNEAVDAKSKLGSQAGSLRSLPKSVFSKTSGYQRSKASKASKAESKRPSIFSKASSRVRREEALK